MKQYMPNRNFLENFLNYGFYAALIILIITVVSMLATLLPVLLFSPYAYTIGGEALIYFTSFLLVFLLAVPPVILRTNSERKRKYPKCPKCVTKHAGEYVGVRLLNSEEVRVPVKVKKTNSRGELTGYQEQYVPGIRKFFRNKFKCKFCKHEFEEINFSVDTAHV